MTSRQSLSRTARLRIFEAAKGVCHLCKQRIQVGQRWDVEHPIPLALGGVDDDSNRAPAHEKCHDQKSKTDAGNLAKAERRRMNHIGIKNRSSVPGSRDTKWKKKFSGEVILR